MRFSLFVALRYFFSKKDWGVVHVISLISLIGIGVASMALLIVLSVFNGFTGVAERMLSFSNPEIMVESQKGKTLSLEEVDISKIRAVEQVKYCAPVVRESVLMSIGESQAIVEMTGVENGYERLGGLDTVMRDCEFGVGSLEEPNAILGYALALQVGLGKGAEKMGLGLQFCSPKSQVRNAIVPEDNLNIASAMYSGSFMTRGDMDADVAFVPLRFAQELLEYDSSAVTSLDIALHKSSQVEKAKKELAKILPEGVSVKDRFEQDPLYFKIVKAERLAVYLILSFIIFIASFNVMGAISLLAMIKQNDIRILSSMGAAQRSVRGIFFNVGMVMSAMGALSGILLGCLFCFVQQTFGIIKIGSEGFVVDSFPVELKLLDIVSVFLLVMLIASICVWVMTKRIKIETNK